MYSSRGSNAYGQQQYGSQSAYGQNLGAGYSGSSVGVPESSSHVSLSSRHSSMLGASHESDVGGFRGHTSATPHYGGQYSSVYGSAALSGAHQVPQINIKGAGSSALEGRGAYTSAISDSPKFASSNYVSTSSHGYVHKGDQIYADKIPDYSAIDRRSYGERQISYLGRELQNESTGRYSDAVGYGHQPQPDIYDRIEQSSSLIRQEQLLKAQAMQSSSLDGGTRQADYLATRGPASRHSVQDLMPYGGRMEADPPNISVLSASDYSVQHAPSILGAAPRRNVDDLVYPQSSSNPGYGVSLPPGRNYTTGKRLLATSSIESDCPVSMFSRSSRPIIDDHKNDRASYLREFELREDERRRENLREREKEREKEKERERERERGREREKQRQRERDRERERMLERREKERERERKRGIEIKRERTPQRVSKDRRGPSLTKEGRSLRRDSPRHEVLHRRQSPVREKRREYVCKVNSSIMVDVERDYLSLDKRYPKLFVSPDVSKVIVNWPSEDLKLSIHTPVSFEHDFIEQKSGVDLKVQSTKLLAGDLAESQQGSTVWNVKLILMSGLSRNALEELSSGKSFDERVPHICNILRFAVLKKDHSLMALGGPWDPVDGSDPAVDSSSLVRTAIRYAKDVTQLDLQNCRNWNRFFEIHYSRVGKDGLFSHKEVTVFFVPDLSECLPSLDAWRTQWHAHRKAVSEREHHLPAKMERPRDKDGVKDKKMNSSKDTEMTVKSEKSGESSSSAQAVEIDKEKSCTDLEGTTNEKGNGSDKNVEKIDGSETAREEKHVEEKDLVETAAAQTTGTVRPGKRKIIRRIVKQKVVDKAASGENSNSKQNDNLDEKDDVEKKNAESEVSGQLQELSTEPAGFKTFTRKKVAKKAVGENTSQNDNKDIPLEVKSEELDHADDKNPKDDSVPSSTAAVQDIGVKTMIKRKIIKRVLKRKVTGKPAVVDTKVDGNGDQKSLVQPGTKTEDAGTQVADTAKTTSPEIKPETAGAQKLDGATNPNKTEINDEKEGKKDGSGADVDTKTVKDMVPQKDTSVGKRGDSKDGEKSKDERPKNDRNGKRESKSNSIKEGKEKRKPEEPPRHPGLILQTKLINDSKLRSLSLSLDSLLGYTDKDIEESSVELSLFAETFYEMLQYQMGCRLLAFLQRLRIKFLTKRNECKRQRSEVQEKEIDKKSPKRSKTDELPATGKPTICETTNSAQPDDKEHRVKEDASADHVNEANVEEEANESKANEETEDEEDPEEDPEEDEEMGDASPPLKPSNENDKEESKTGASDQPGKDLSNAKDEADEASKEKTITETAESKHSDVNRKQETGKKEIVNKELLQAFRFFDRNDVGYVRVEDLRLIIHSLRKFLSHRDVKELVQSALLESNTGRDDRILYYKLVRMSDI